MIKACVRKAMHRPLFTVTTSVTLALVIGVSTTAFHVVGAVLFSGAPFLHSERMVRLWDYSKVGETRYFSYRQLNEFKNQCDAFSGIVSCGWRPVSLAVADRPAEKLWALNVTPEFFDVFQMQPKLGRAFTPEEYVSGQATVAILTHDAWSKRFGSDPRVVGTSVQLDGGSVLIVGVMPEAFDYRPAWEVKVDLVRPNSMPQYAMENEAQRFFQAVGRLKPTATLAQAQAQINAVSTRMAMERPAIYGNHQVKALAMNDTLISRPDRFACILLGALALVILLIGCLNLANMYLVRSTHEYHDMVVRTAIGATKSDLVRDQTLNVIAGSIPGFMGGLALAYALTSLVQRNPAISDELSVSGRFALSILLWNVGAVLVTVIAAGVLPACFTTNVSIATALRGKGRGSTVGKRQRRWQAGLVIGELALALVLLSAASAIEVGLRAYTARDHGWTAQHLVFATFRLPEGARYKNGDDIRALHRNLQERLQQIPGVQSVALGTSVPVAFNTSELPISADNVVANPTNLPAAAVSHVTSDYFEAMGIRVVQGSSFSAGIAPGDDKVAVISESVAKRYWPGEDAVGRRLVTYTGNNATSHRIVGVVRDVEFAANWTTANNDLRVYEPLVMEPWSYFNAIVRGADVQQIRKGLVKVSASLDPEIMVEDVQTTEEAMNRLQPRIALMRQVIQWFALVGLLLSTSGLFGVVSIILAQRSSEFSLRIALGATGGSISWLAIRWVLQVIALGAVFGLIGSMFVVSALTKVLPVISGQLASTIPISIVVLGLAAVVASLIPTIRATRANPAVMLRSE